jgi:hypothetical protein
MTGLPHAVVRRAKNILLPTLRCEEESGLPERGQRCVNVASVSQMKAVLGLDHFCAEIFR